MKTISTAMDAHVSGVLTSLCTCWKITRTDGEVLGFTDHDKDLLIDEVNYVASAGYYRSAISNSADSAVDNLDVSGFLDDSSLNETELRNGAYDYAEVEVFAVNWQDLSQGIIRLRYGLFGEVMIASSGFFKVELRGLTQLFSQTIVETYSPECRADLGDHRCKVPLTPPVRASVHSYQVGDRILVPIPPGVSSDIPLSNPGFELRSASHNWDIFSGAVDNTNNLGQAILDQYETQTDYRMMVESASGSVSFRRSRSLVGEAGIPDLEAEVTVLPGGEDVQFRVTAYWGHGIEPETPLIASDFNKTSDWIVLSSVGETTISLPDPLLPASAVVSGTQPTWVRYVVEWQDAVPGSVYFEGYALVDGIPIPKALLEPGSTTDVSASDWELSLFNARYTGPTVWMSPYAGDWNLELGPASKETAYARQTVSIASLTNLLDEVDDGTLTIKVEASSGAATVGVQNFISLVFYNDEDSVIGIADQDPVSIHGRGFWGPLSFSAPVPPLTRSVRIQLNTYNPTLNARSRGVWDNVNVRVFQDSYENQGNYLEYGGVEFVCTQEGVTQVVPPAYSYTLGNVTSDGSAQFTATSPLHMFVTEITEVINNKQFKVTGDVDKENSWFEWGVLEMLSGLNIKKKVEMTAWDNDTKTITLALGLPYVPVVGDKLRMHTGCAKTRAVCTTKFDNMNNYRGEPDIPGTDQYFKVGAANSGSSAPPGKGGK